MARLREGDGEIERWFVGVFCSGRLLSLSSGFQLKF